MANNVYGLYPWQWNAPGANNPIGYHSAPAGASCVLDFRPLGEQAKAMQSGGYGFFAWPVGGIAPPNDLISLGTGDVRSIVASNAAKTELKTKLGLGSNPVWTGATLADCLGDILGPFAVPDGSTGPKPNMPQTDGLLIIELSGHSPVWSMAVNNAELFSAIPGKRHSKIRDVIRSGIDQALAIGGADLAGKVLDAELEKYGWSKADREAAQKGGVGRKAEYERLLSTNAKVNGKVKPVKHETTQSESWPTTGAITSGQNLTWEVADGAFNVSSAGVLRETMNTYRGLARCTSAVSSADHYATLSVAPPGWLQPGTMGPCGRFSANPSVNYYLYEYASTTSRFLYKRVGAALTQLAAPGVCSFTNGDVWRVTCNGSTITGSDPRNADLSVTDTTITGNLLGGVDFFDDTNNHTFNYAGAFSIVDLAVAPVAAFSGAPLSGTAPLSVAFTNTSSDDTSWLWETNDGSGWTTASTVENPTIVFAAGTHSVRLTATGPGGDNTLTRTDYVVVSAAGGGNGLLLGVG